MADVPPPPPPPENPFMNENGDPGAAQGGFEESLEQGAPNVAARPGRMLVVVGSVALVLGLLLYAIFSGGKKDTTQVKEKPHPVVEIAPPPLPQAPPLLAPPPTITPPTIPQPASIDIIRPEQDAAAKQQEQNRMHSRMMLQDSGDGGGSLSSILSPSKDTSATASKDPNSAFSAGLANTQADKVEATNIGNLRRTIAQGRIIQATMESALNTDLPAPIRAIVSRDTYAEAGTTPLIPKGSRLIGVYNTDLTGGQSRVFVVWTRVIRPDGVDVALNSPLVDQIGQAGIGGQIDTKFQQIFSRSVLSSIVNIAFAIGSDKINGGTTSTTTNSDGGSTTSGNASSTATVNALNRLGSVTDSFVQKFVDVRPTILVDQGTQVNVFVNRDLVFPDGDGTGARILN